MKYDIKKYLDTYYKCYNKVEGNKAPSEDVLFLHVDVELLTNYFQGNPDRFLSLSKIEFPMDNVFTVIDVGDGEQFVAIIKNLDRGKYDLVTFEPDTSKTSELVTAILSDMLDNKKTKLAQKTYTVSKANKGKSKVLPITYLKIDGYESSRKSVGNNTEMIWTHSWECMGHWRTIDSETIGKDRDGIYQIKGKTWVNPCVKGAGELIKKIRVIKN